VEFETGVAEIKVLKDKLDVEEEIVVVGKVIVEFARLIGFSVVVVVVLCANVIFGAIGNGELVDREVESKGLIVVVVLVVVVAEKMVGRVETEVIIVTVDQLEVLLVELELLLGKGKNLCQKISGSRLPDSNR